MAHRALKGAYTQVMGLEPLPPTASPDSRTEFARTLNKANRLVGLMHTHITSIMTASNVGAQEDTDDEPDVTDAETRKTTPATRIAEITRSVEGAGPLPVAEWVLCLLEPRKQTLMEAEQEGFVRLLRGYESAPSMQELLSQEVELSQQGDFRDISERSVALESNKDLVERMHERETLMTGMQSADALHSFMISILRTIHAIRFSIEWAQLAPAAKTRFREDACDQLAPELTYAQFQHRHEKLIKARNDLKKMFLKFGARVLMDPCWAPYISYNTGSTGRSTTFPGTLREMLSGFDDLTEDEMNADEGAFRQLILALADDETMAYIYRFLNTHRRAT
ncbi:hypothetical protein CVT26_004220 [Gymnopilus dilepis]|uniref:Uncharacterized protein n=1 Tax=Gymnopilus dilepis TaxID=231916 RepID=A0A409YMX6_9AGAR|nr:hypothetical protein CVT26_004220 [Gymnopilus dilepis]